ncbi:MAG: EamA family transporter RarD [Blautia sp.]|jgi:chloramphenicol-sensitive protein RarD
MFQKKSLVCVIVSYILWGLLPVFWKLLAAVDSVYVLFSRVVWSLVFSFLLLLFTKRLSLLKGLWKNKKILGMAFLAGVTVCINWGSYIWAVNNGHLLDASFGYYLNPLLVVLAGFLVFRERPSKGEWTAILLSAAGVLYGIFASGTVPVLALIIGGSFAIYGMIKKLIPLESDISLFVETALVTPIALPILIAMDVSGKGSAGILTGPAVLLLPLAGVITGVPLLLYAKGVKGIPYYLTGIIMYLNPTIQFLMSIFLYKEPFSQYQLVTFGFIWLGIFILIISGMQKKKALTPQNSLSS